MMNKDGEVRAGSTPCHCGREKCPHEESTDLQDAHLMPDSKAKEASLPVADSQDTGETAKEAQKHQCACNTRRQKLESLCGCTSTAVALRTILVGKPAVCACSQKSSDKK